MEQSATPWRVFDAPSNGNDAQVAAGRDGATPAGGTAQDGGDPRATKLAIAGVTGALVIGAVAVAVALSGSAGRLVDAPDRAVGGSNDTAMLAGAGELVVDVTGAVARPGIYRLPAGSRVGDAIEAAGGFGPRVDAARVAETINLAAALADGSQVHVPSRDDAASAPAEGGGGAATAGSAGGAGRVNLNTASQSELEALPGIGPVTATKIIDSRSALPFTSVDDLRSRKLVGEKAFELLKSLVGVG